MSADDVSLLRKEIEIQLSKATHGGICKKKNSDNFMTSIHSKLTVSCEVTKF